MCVMSCGIWIIQPVDLQNSGSSPNEAKLLRLSSVCDIFYCPFQVDDSFTTFDECVTDVKTPQEHVEFSLYEITGIYHSIQFHPFNNAILVLSLKRFVVHFWIGLLSFYFL
jgi:hypothetical protein